MICCVLVANSCFLVRFRVRQIELWTVGLGYRQGVLLVNSLSRKFLLEDFIRYIVGEMRFYRFGVLSLYRCGGVDKVFVSFERWW